MGRDTAGACFITGVLLAGKTPETRATITTRLTAASKPKAFHCRKPASRTFGAEYFAATVDTDAEPLAAASCGPGSGARIGMTRPTSVALVRALSTTPKIASLATGRAGDTSADRESLSIRSWLRRLNTWGGRT